MANCQSYDDQIYYSAEGYIYIMYKSIPTKSAQKQ